MIRTIELLEPTGAASVVDADVEGENLWLSKYDLAATTGFELKPEGLCRDELCYPLPPGRESDFARDGKVNVAAFWRLRGGAVVHSNSGDVWVLDMLFSDDVNVHVMAEVVRVTAAHVALAFARIPEDVQVSLWNLLCGYADTLERWDDELDAVRG